MCLSRHKIYADKAPLVEIFMFVRRPGIVCIGQTFDQTVEYRKKMYIWNVQGTKNAASVGDKGKILEFLFLFKKHYDPKIMFKEHVENKLISKWFSMTV